MEEKKMNFFAIPAFTFVPPKYKEIIKESAGKIFAALLICFLIMACINAVKVNSAMNEVTDELRDNCPEFELMGGEFEIEKPFSFDEDNVYVEIDDSIENVTEDDVKEIVLNGNYQSVIIIGKYSFGMYNNGQIQSFKYTDFDNFTISKDKLCDEFMPMIKNIAVFVVILWAFVSIGVFYFVALIMQLFTMMFASIFGKELDGVQRYRMTILAKFPIHVIVFVIGLIKPSLIGFWANLVLQVVFIALAVFMYDNDDDVVEVPVEAIEDKTEDNSQF